MLPVTVMGFQCRAHPAELTNQIEEAATIGGHPAKLTWKVEDAATTDCAHENYLDHAQSAFLSSIGLLAR